MVGVETTIVSEGTSSQKDKCTVFLSFVEVSFEFLDKHVLFRISMMVRKVARSHREGVVSREGGCNAGI